MNEGHRENLPAMLKFSSFYSKHTEKKGKENHQSLKYFLE